MQRRRRVVAELQDHLAASQSLSLPSGIDAGLHTVLALPESLSEAEVAAAARAESVGIDVLGRYWMSDGPHPPALIVGYSAAPDHSFAPALLALKRVLDACRG